jgi:predicted ATPase/signal transduction histidine kinase
MSDRAVEIRRTGRYLVSRVTGPAGELVVSKQVLATGPDPRAAAERLRHEHELLLSLDLPGVVRPLGFRSDPSTPALLMEDAGPRDLDAWLRGKPLPLAEFFRLAIPLAELLARLHARNVIHRDISPGNVVLDEGGRPTLVDFEGAALVGPDPLAGVAPHPEADPPYLAPEQTGRTSRLVDRRADLYSLGATFYQMLTGAPPFRASDPMELVHAHLAQPPLPLDRVNAAVPAVLSDIVLRLLAKMPERRYQRGEGLLADLREAAARLEPSGAVAPFELGLDDLARELPLPSRLYGREADLGRLRAAWGRVKAGGTEVLVLTGEAGLGKSALVEALSEVVVQEGGEFTRGRSDQRESNIPYGALVEAFRGLLRRLAAGPRQEAAIIRERLTTGLGASSAVIAALIPEIEDLIGAAPSLPELGPRETQNRFKIAFGAFVRALTRPERPLVLLVDDLQWADSATVELIRVLADTPGLGHFLLICASRDAAGAAGVLETGGAREGCAVSALALAPLETSAVLALCCDVLSAPSERCLALAGMLTARSGGNPFFVRRLLRHLQQAELLVNNPEAGGWTWDIDRIASVGVTDNVAELLAETLRRLPLLTRRLLLIGACVGGRFATELVAAVAGEAVAAARAALWTAAAEGHLVPEQDGFRFGHDRVQQAAYAQPGEDRAAIHLRIGRILLAGSAALLERELFDVVDQLDLGASRIEERAERLQVAELGWRAAQRAKNSSAWGPAEEYLDRARALLPDDAWQTAEALALAIHRDATQLALLGPDVERSERLFQEVLTRAREPADQADLCRLRLQVCASRGDWEASMRWGREGLRLLGFDLPADPCSAGLAEHQSLERNLAGRDETALASAPPVQSPRLHAAMELLASLQTPAFFGDQDLWLYCVGRLLNLSLEHGRSASTSLGYVSYAAAIQELTGDYRRAYQIGRIGLAMAARLGDAGMECRCVASFVASVAPWREPIGESFPMMTKIHAPAVAAGELSFAAACDVTAVMLLFHRGTPLDRVLLAVDDGLEFVRGSNSRVELARCLAYRQAVQRLQGSERRGEVGPEGQPAGHHILWLGVAYLLGDLVEARQRLEAGRTAAVARAVEQVERCYYSALTMAATSGDLEAVAEAHVRMARWAESCPENYRHKELVLAAELARLRGQSLEAAELYDRAAAAAAGNGFLQDEGLANELAGRFHRAAGREGFARLYLAAAVDAYRRWGARAKVEALEDEFPDLGASRFREGLRSGEVDASVDLVALFRAAEALSSEVVLSRLCGKLIEVCVASAGAERGALVLAEEGGLFVRALGPSTEPITLGHEPLGTSARVAVSVIEQVRRTGEALVLSDAQAHEEFRHDAYVAAQGVRSLLVLPILHQGTLLGVLHLENNLATRVFAPARVRLLQLLSSQIAISLQNSQLFEHLTHEVDERRRAERALRFLADAGATLSETLDYQDALGKLPALALPTLGDWCLVYALENGAIRRVAAAEVDPTRRALLSELESGPDGPCIGEQVAEVVRSGAPRVLEIPRGAGVSGSAMVLPLSARGRPVGGLALISAEDHQRFGPRELALGQELARRAAVAIDNARLYREAREAVAVRDEFMSIASHELNTPLTSLQLMVDALSDEALGGVELLPRAVPIISRQSQRLRSLVNDLLDVTNIRRGELPLRLEDVDLAAVVRETVERFGADLARAGCLVSVDAPMELVGRWDRARLEQVVTNLLSNAIKFAAGKPIEIAVLAIPRAARLEVADHGMGIPADRLPHVFGRFERAVPAQKYGGLGLGLYIVHEIVRSLGGKVSVDSVVHVGSRFTVDLPLGGRSGAKVSARAPS